MGKIDVHMHVTLEPSAQEHDGIRFVCAKDMLPIMDQYGIDKSILMSSGEKAVTMGNKELREICERYPEYFYYLAMFDIDNEEDLEARILEEMKSGAKGIGEFTTNIAFDDPKMLKLLKILETHDIPLLFHLTPQLGNYYGIYDEPGLPKLEYVLQKFPNVKIIGHSQPFWYEMTAHSGDNTPEERNTYPVGLIENEGRVQELFRKYPNLYGDLSANSGGNAIMRDVEYGYKFLEEFQDRLMYGTDLFALDQYFPLGDYLENALENDKISQSVYNKITRENAVKVFGL